MARSSSALAARPAFSERSCSSRSAEDASSDLWLALTAPLLALKLVVLLVGDSRDGYANGGASSVTASLSVVGGVGDDVVIVAADTGAGNF